MRQKCMVSNQKEGKNHPLPYRFYDSELLLIDFKTWDHFAEMMTDSFGE